MLTCALLLQARVCLILYPFLHALHKCNQHNIFTDWIMLHWSWLSRLIWLFSILVGYEFHYKWPDFILIFGYLCQYLADIFDSYLSIDFQEAVTDGRRPGLQHGRRLGINGHGWAFVWCRQFGQEDCCTISYCVLAWSDRNKVIALKWSILVQRTVWCSFRAKCRYGCLEVTQELMEIRTFVSFYTAVYSIVTNSHYVIW